MASTENGRHKLRAAAKIREDVVNERLKSIGEDIPFYHHVSIKAETADRQMKR